jgi:threonine/homoserine/homoserine lactone efflux protein
MPDLTLFVSAVASILLSPGPTNTLLSASGALVGFTRSAHLILMELAGYGISIGIWLRYVRPVVDDMPQLGLAVRFGLICYLLVLARHLWRTRMTPTERTAVISGARVFFTTLLNPKALVFAFAIFPTLCGVSQTILYGGAFAVTAVPISTGWILFGASVGHYMGDKLQKLLPRLTAVIIAGFACGMTLSVISRSTTVLPSIEDLAIKSPKLLTPPN